MPSCLLTMLAAICDARFFRRQHAEWLDIFGAILFQAEPHLVHVLLCLSLSDEYDLALQ